MKTFRLKRDNDKDLFFAGHVVATVNSLDDRDSTDVPAYYTELTLYLTGGDTYICQTRGLAADGSTRPRCKAAIATSVAEVMEHFGHRWLANKLYARAGFDNTLYVE